MDGSASRPAVIARIRAALPPYDGAHAVGARGGDAYYQITITDATPAEQARRHVPQRGSMAFIAAVGDRSGQRPME